MINKIEMKIFGTFLNRFFSPFVRFILTIDGVKIGSRCKFVGRPIVARYSNSEIIIRSKVVLVSKSKFTALGVSKPVIIRTLLSDSKIEIGENTGLSGVTVCAALRVSIGARCLIGADVLITDTDFHPVDVLNRRYLPLPNPKATDGIVIGDDVFIGARSIILKGVTIGNGSVIGAGSVVTKDIPTNVIAAGNPAKVLRVIVPQHSAEKSSKDS